MAVAEDVTSCLKKALLPCAFQKIAEGVKLVTACKQFPAITVRGSHHEKSKELPMGFLVAAKFCNFTEMNFKILFLC